jgi:hypothetical protein
MSRRIFNSCISFSSTDSNICIASNMMYYKFSVYLCSGRVHWRCLNIFIPAISTAQLKVDTGSCGKVCHRKHRTGWLNCDWSTDPELRRGDPAGLTAVIARELSIFTTRYTRLVINRWYLKF